MSVVTLVSGGLDSTLVSLLVKETGVEQFPLFINYNQLNFKNEFTACKNNLKKHNITKPELMDISGYGQIILSGLTTSSMHIKDEAFLPGRNLMFLLMGSAYAFEKGADSVSIGLLDESMSLFPDQTEEFVKRAEELISFSIGRSIKLLTPLINFNKAEVVALAKEKGIKDTYSCHAGTEEPCGKCIACLEYKNI